VTAYYATHGRHPQPILQFAVATSEKVVAPLNALGVAAIFFCVVALWLKDLEEIARAPCAKAAARGYFAGFIRRSAGDLSLWGLGVLASLASAFGIVCCVEGITPADRAAVAYAVALLSLFGVILGGLNIGVRRGSPTVLPGMLGGAGKLSGAYLTMLIVLTAGLIYPRAIHVFLFAVAAAELIWLWRVFRKPAPWVQPIYALTRL